MRSNRLSRTSPVKREPVLLRPPRHRRPGHAKTLRDRAHAELVRVQLAQLCAFRIGTSRALWQSGTSRYGQGMSFWELLFTTSASAFFASMAAVVVTAWLARLERHRSGRAAVLGALLRHQERLLADPARRERDGQPFVDSVRVPISCYVPNNANANITVAEMTAQMHLLRRKDRELIGGLADSVRGISMDISVAQEINEITGLISSLAWRGAWSGHRQSRTR